MTKFLVNKQICTISSEMHHSYRSELENFHHLYSDIDICSIKSIRAPFFASFVAFRLIPIDGYRYHSRGMHSPRLKIKSKTTLSC